MEAPESARPSVGGLTLCREFYWQAVRPILDRHFPNLSHSAALIGDGSEVLGFDDAVSTDHHWGPRVMLFIAEEGYERQAIAIREALANNLPYDFAGYPTNFAPPDRKDNKTQLLQAIDHGRVNHRATTHTLRGFFSEHLGWDPDGPLEPADWLTFPEQKLRATISGAVYHDGIGLESERRRLSYYPHDVWLYLLGAGWARIGQEEHLMGRAGLVGDEVGSALIGARLVRDVMRLCFLMERTYAPYAKWFGTAFKQLTCAAKLWPDLQGALTAGTWQERERFLVPAYEHIARKHNSLGLTEPLPTQATGFHERPFRVIATHGFADALLREIRDPAVREIAARRPIGSIDQFSDSTDILSDPTWRPTLRQLYHRAPAP